MSSTEYRSITAFVCTVCLALAGSLSPPLQAQVGLSAEGIVESTSGGFRFPDGTTQTTAAFQNPLANVIRVSSSGGDFTTITAALSSISDNGPDNRYQIFVGPGEYSAIVTMKPYVDIVGSGRNVTRLTHNGGSSLAVVNTASNAELRNLTVENDGSGSNSFALGVYNDGTSPTITNVDVYASGASFNYATYNQNGAHPVLRDVKSTAGEGSSAVGMYVFNSNVTVHNSRFSGTDDVNGNGIYTTHGGSTDYMVTLTDSEVEASQTLLRGSSQVTVVVAGSKLHGGGVVTRNGATLTCVYSYDDSGAALDELCAPPAAPARYEVPASSGDGSPPVPSP